MKHMLLALLFVASAGCTRPLYVSRSDTRTACMQGAVAKIREIESDVRTVMTYNRAGNITLMEQFRGSDSLPFNKEVYLYDPSGGRIMRSEEYNLAKGTLTVIEYEYDAVGNLVSEHETGGTYGSALRYNRLGYLKERTDVYYGAKSPAVKYRYDMQGRLRKVRAKRDSLNDGYVKRHRYYPNGIISVERTKSTIDRYDERGNLNSMTAIVNRRNEKGRVWGKIRFTLDAAYEFDALGNWTKRTLLHRDRPQKATLREIEYFDPVTRETE